MSLLDVKGFSFGYNSEFPVFNNINLEISEGEFVAVIGPNGAGKSTLLSCLAGVESAFKGIIMVRNKNIKEYGYRQLAAIRSIIYQETVFFFPFTVVDIINMAGYSKAKPDPGLISEYLNLLELNELSKRPVNQLSGGEKQRVLFARALVQSPQILFLDEAHANLDVKFIKNIFSFLKQKVLKEKITVIAVMHDINLAMAYADRFIILHKNKIALDGNKEIISEDNLEKIFSVRPSVFKNNNKTNYVNFYEK